MPLDRDLLEQAQHLVRREPRRPRQASLRRAISTAYYALFHLLVREASAMAVKDNALRSLVARAFDHGEMKQASQAFASAGLPPHVTAVMAGAIPAELRTVARAFVDLQEARHEADYRVNRSFTRTEATDLVTQASQAFLAWRAIRTLPIARVYLASLLLWKKWSK